MTRVLVTGFEPFGGGEVNPSQLRPDVRGGFVHVPLLPEQALAAKLASLPLETLVRAGRILLAVTLGQ